MAEPSVFQHFAKPPKAFRFEESLVVVTEEGIGVFNLEGTLVAKFTPHEAAQLWAEINKRVGLPKQTLRFECAGRSLFSVPEDNCPYREALHEHHYFEVEA